MIPLRFTQDDLCFHDTKSIYMNDQHLRAQGAFPKVLITVVAWYSPPRLPSSARKGPRWGQGEGHSTQ